MSPCLSTVPVGRIDHIAEEGAQDGYGRCNDSRGEFSGCPDQKFARIVSVITSIKTGNLDSADNRGYTSTILLYSSLSQCYGTIISGSATANSHEAQAHTHSDANFLIAPHLQVHDHKPGNTCQQDIHTSRVRSCKDGVMDNYGSAPTLAVDIRIPSCLSRGAPDEQKNSVKGEDDVQRDDDGPDRPIQQALGDAKQR